MNAGEKAVLATREVGMHPYGHLLGIWCEQLSSGRCSGEFAVSPYCVDEKGDVEIGALATLGDMALQTSLLSLYPGQRLITFLLQVRHFGSKPGHAVRISAHAVHSDERAGLAHGTFIDEKGTPIADVCGTFVPIPPPASWRPLPWEVGLKRPAYTAAPNDLVFSDAESLQIKSLNALLKNETANFSNVIDLGKPFCQNPHWIVPWTPATHLLNRAEEVQGGATYGALALASKAMVGDSVDLIEHKVQFFKPAKTSVTISVEVLHEGRRFASTLSRMLDSEGRPLAVGCSQFSKKITVGGKRKREV